MLGLIGSALMLTIPTLTEIVLDEVLTDHDCGLIHPAVLGIPAVLGLGVAR